MISIRKKSFLVIRSFSAYTTHRSTDVTYDGIILRSLQVVRVPQGGVDLLPALPLQLLDGPLHLRLGQVGLPGPGAFPVESGQPVLVDVVEVVGAHLLGPQHHRGHLVGLHLVATAGVHADQLLGQGEPLTLVRGYDGADVRLRKTIWLDRNLKGGR